MFVEDAEFHEMSECFGASIEARGDPTIKHRDKRANCTSLGLLGIKGDVLAFLISEI